MSSITMIDVCRRSAFGAALYDQSRTELRICRVVLDPVIVVNLR